ncbi:MAG: hypothetical protein QXK06_00380 [Candidatus Diapherotrites archaeon]
MLFGFPLKFFDQKFKPVAFLSVLALLVFFASNSFAQQRVELANPVCFYDVNQMHEYFTDLQGNKIPNLDFIRLFSAIEAKPQNDPSIKDEIKRALRGQFYTGYLQLAYTIEGGKKNPFKGGNYAKCDLGCFPQFTYFGRTYYNKCITRICTEGRMVGTPRFCDPKIGPDIYIHYLTFWCEDVPQATMICGPSAHCEQRADGTFLCEYNSATSSNQSNGVEYVLVAPADSSSQIMVAAYQNGKLIASKPIGTTGPVHASQAYAFAQSTGLASVVASALQQKTTTTASSKPSTTYSASYNGSTNYSSTPIRMQVVASATKGLSAYRAPTATYKTYSTTSTASTATYAYSTSQTKSTSASSYSSSTTYSPTKTTYSNTVSPYSTSNYRIQATTYNPTRTAYSTNAYTSTYSTTTQATASVSKYRQT